MGGPKLCYTDLTIPWYSYTRVYEHMKHARKHKYVQIILVPLHPYQQVLYLFVDGVINSLHIMEHLAMHYRLGHSHLNKL